MADKFRASPVPDISQLVPRMPSHLLVLMRLGTFSILTPKFHLVNYPPIHTLVPQMAVHQFLYPSGKVRILSCGPCYLIGHIFNVCCYSDVVCTMHSTCNKWMSKKKWNANSRNSRSYQSVHNSLRLCSPTTILPAVLYWYQKWSLALR